MTKTVLGIFTEHEEAEKAINRLKDKGYNPKDISIVMKDSSERRELAENSGTDVVGDTLTGATAGAALGGLGGLLASFALPGLGAFFIGGPIATALGLTGAAAATVSGATTGLLAGGLLGALTGVGLTAEEAKVYEKHIREGGILVIVPARMGEEQLVEQILSECEANEIKTVTHESEDRFEKMQTVSRAADQRESHASRASLPTHNEKKGEGRGWFGDSKEHARAAKGMNVSGRS